MKRVVRAFVSALSVALGLSGIPSWVDANTQENAVIALHARTAVTGKGLCTPGMVAPNIPCSSYTDTWPTLTPAMVYLVVAKADSAEGIRGLSCGIDYGPGVASGFVSWTMCATGLQAPDVAWPGPGTGIRLSWASATCQRTTRGSDGVHAVAGFFYLYTYSGPEEFAIIENPTVTTPELRVADCSGVESFDIPVALAGRVSFTDSPGTEPGYNPCTDCVPLVCATSSLVGTSATVPNAAGATLTVDNCSGSDETIDGTWYLNGSPSGSFGSVVSAGGSAQYALPVPCSTAGTWTVTATFSAAIGAGTSCMVSGFTDSVVVECTAGKPLITSILDVGNDQGRLVRINFERSNFDQAGSPTPILAYEAFRRILPAPAGAPTALPLAERPAAGIDPAGREIRLHPLLANWEFVGSVPAHGELEYNMVVPTLGDSTDASGIYWSAFFIRAATAVPTTFYDSDSDSGYSVDNLAPAAPFGFAFLAPGRLEWDEAAEPDFDYFSVYGSVNNVFDESAVLIATLTGTEYNVQLHSHQYYHVTATDFAGNEGPAASAYNTVSVLPDPAFVPTVYALAQSRPNPFRSTAAISFDLPEAEASVRLRVFDISGSLVKTLVDGPLGAGRYNVSWSGTDEIGRPVSPGIYFYRIDARTFQKTGKAVRIQ